MKMKKPEKKKLKTKKALAKRIKVTKTGGFLRKKAGKSHLLSGKTRKRKRHLRATGKVAKSHEKMVRRAMPYA